MRYFRTTNASRRYTVGGFAFVFEPIGQIGGSWSGVLEVGDDSASTALAAALPPQIEEITAEIYADVKKNASKSLRPTNEFHQPHPSSMLPSAAPVAEKVASTISQNEQTRSLRYASVDVPDELRLIDDVKKMPRA